MSRRGEDLPGNLIVGEESFARWQGIEFVSRRRDDYPALAQATIAGHPPGSSAGGERPKFGALVGNQHMLVKFAGRAGVGDMAARHWCDLLILRSEEHTSELQSRLHLVCRLLLEKKKKSEIVSQNVGLPSTDKLSLELMLS